MNASHSTPGHSSGASTAGDSPQALTTRRRLYALAAALTTVSAVITGLATHSPTAFMWAGVAVMWAAFALRAHRQLRAAQAAPVSAPRP